MPELPEVETVRRGLVELVVGKTIKEVSVRLPRIVRTPDDVRRFAAELQGLTIEDINRRGKYLLISVPPYTLISHLRMEGQYRVAEAGEAEAPHTHVVFYFTDGTELRYRDVRQFGTMDLISPGEAGPNGLATLGPEPFDGDLDGKKLYQIIHRRTTSIKAVLLNQSSIAGLGNIYVDEALFAVGMHPELPASRVTQKQAAELLQAIREVLQQAIDAGGSSIKSYVNGYGRHGGFQVQLNVYARDGEPCRQCGSEIQKLRVATRGTHICPVCQKRPRTLAVKQSGPRGARAGLRPRAGTRKSQPEV